MVNKKREKVPLSVTHPELAEQAVGWDPGVVTHGSSLNLLLLDIYHDSVRRSAWAGTVDGSKSNAIGLM